MTRQDVDIWVCGCADLTWIPDNLHRLAAVWWMDCNATNSLHGSSKTNTDTNTDTNADTNTDINTDINTNTKTEMGYKAGPIQLVNYAVGL